jgi:hypothetical protein
VPYLRFYVHILLVARDSIVVTHFGLRSSCIFQATFFPFGFPVSVTSNSEQAIAVIRDEWAAWPQAFDDPPFELHFEVTEAHGPLPPSMFRSRGHLFAFAADANNFVIGDTRARTATAFLSSSVIEDRPHFIYHFLDAAAFQLITSANFTPIHGATVARNGRGVLFTGDSGAGKSSLSYACARDAGRAAKNRWTFVSDDASHLLRRCAASRCIVGVPHQVRLRPDAPNLFPELAAFEPKMRGTGKLSLQIPTRDLAIATEPTAFVDTIVLPKRVVGSPTRFQPIDKALVREHCAQWFYHWDPPILAEQEAAFEEMIEGVRTFSLEYSDLDVAVRLLDTLSE